TYFIVSDKHLSNHNFAIDLLFVAAMILQVEMRKSLGPSQLKRKWSETCYTAWMHTSLWDQMGYTQG
ncbi:unnamed protein product, partial [Bubo scandiacus]